jgi:hypothetical protein
MKRKGKRRGSCIGSSRLYYEAFPENGGEKIVNLRGRPQHPCCEPTSGAEEDGHDSA